MSLQIDFGSIPAIVSKIAACLGFGIQGIRSHLNARTGSSHGSFGIDVYFVLSQYQAFRLRLRFLWEQQ